MFFLFPSGRINPKAIRAMAELDYEFGTHASEGLERIDGESGDAAFREVRDEIGRRVRKLLARL